VDYLGDFQCPQCLGFCLSASGWCAPCEAWTGLCGAGRSLENKSPPPYRGWKLWRWLLLPRSWMTPCPLAGAVGWELMQLDGSQQRMLLCEGHDDDLCRAVQPWIRNIRHPERQPKAAVRR
jgi:hypothetical protein